MAGEGEGASDVGAAKGSEGGDGGSAETKTVDGAAGAASDAKGGGEGKPLLSGGGGDVVDQKGGDGGDDGKGTKDKAKALLELPEGADWRDLAADEKNRGRLQRVSSVDELAEMARDYDSFKRRAVLPPNSNSSDEDVAKFRKAIGVPDSPDGYEIEMDKDADDGAKSRVERLKGAAHAVHMTPQQLGALIEWHSTEMDALEAADGEAIAQRQAELKTELSREWGADYQRNASVAMRTAQEAFGGYAEEFLAMELKDGTRVGDHPAMLRGMAKLGRKFGEAGLPGTIVPHDWNPTDSEIIEMKKDPRYWDSNRRDPAFVQKINNAIDRSVGKI